MSPRPRHPRPTRLKRRNADEYVDEYELEIRDGSGKWQMIKQSHKSELAPKVVAAIRQAREEALAIPTGEGKPRRYAPMGLAESLAERYGVTPDRIKQIWGGRVG